METNNKIPNVLLLVALPQELSTIKIESEEAYKETKNFLPYKSYIEIQIVNIKS
jgi:hypothetical protein